ncbi:MAG: hypothetical protein ACRDT0_11400, partial [Pseudonocardiaceae bacterium]
SDDRPTPKPPARTSGRDGAAAPPVALAGVLPGVAILARPGGRALRGAPFPDQRAQEAGCWGWIADAYRRFTDAT